MGMERELRLSTDENKEIGYNVNTIVVVVSFVCIIGIIVGYLLHRKRRKSAQKNHKTSKQIVRTRTSKLSNQRLLLISALLLFCISDVCGEDTDEIVSYQPRRRYPQAGHIIKSECLDSQCQEDCIVVSRQAVHFGICHQQKLHHCDQEIDFFISFDYDDAYCLGTPSAYISSDGCYTRSSDDGCCGMGWPYDDKYYKYECEIAHGELRYSLTDGHEDKSGDMSVVMLSIACIFGIVAGYLLYNQIPNIKR